MKRESWIYLVKLAVISIMLGWGWFSWVQELYPELIRPVAFAFFKMAGVHKWLLMLTMHHFTNLVPYLALVLSMPGLFREWKRAMAALLGGISTIVLVHILMSIAVYYIWLRYGYNKTAYRLMVPIYLINDSLPLVLCLAFYWRKLQDLFPVIRFTGSRKHL